MSPGERISHYEVQDLLGRGGMGVVHRARDVHTGRTVVVKQLLGDAAPTPEAVRRFEREGRAAAAVDDPNLVRILDAGVHAGRPFLVLEYVPGGSLQARLKERGPLPWREACAVGAALARGLAALHAAGLVHRDLKPANVLVAADGRVKLADLGLVHASAASGLTRGGLTRTGELLGTYEYLAPEQAEGSKQLDARADLYALGALLHALVAGRPPFEGTSIVLLKKHLLDAPPRLRALAPHTPRALEALVLRLLAKDPAQRPATAAEVAAALEALAAAPTSAAPALGRAAALAGALLAAVALGAGLAVLALGRPGAAPGPPTTPATAAAPPPTTTTTTTTTAAPTTTTPTPTMPPTTTPDGRGVPRVQATLGRDGRELGTDAWTLCDQVGAVAVAPGGATCLAGGNASCLLELDLESGALVRAHDLGPEPTYVTRLDVRGERALALGHSRGAYAGGVHGGWGLWVLDPAGPGRTCARVPGGAGGPPPGAALLLPGDRALVAQGPLVAVVDLRAGARVTEAHFAGSTGAALAVSPAGDQALVGARGAAHLVGTADLAARARLALAAPEASVSAAAFAPDGARALLATDQGPIEVWRLGAAPERVGVLRTHDGPVAQVVWCPSGAAASAGANVAAVWDVDRARSVRGVTSQGRLASVALTADGATVLGADLDWQRVRRWDVARGFEAERGAGHGAAVQGMTFTPDGAALFSAGQDGALRAWDVAGGIEQGYARRGGTSRAVAMGPEGRWVAATSGGLVQRWPLAGTEPLDAPELATHRGEAVALVVLRDGRVASAGHDGVVRVADPSRAAPLLEVVLDPTNWLYGLAVVERPGARPRDPELLVLAPARRAGLLGARVRGREVTPLAVRSVAQPEPDPQAIAAAPDGGAVVVGGFDGRLHRFRVRGDAVEEDGAFVAAPAGSPVTAVALSPDGRLGCAATGESGVDRGLRLFDAVSGAPLDRLDLGPRGDFPRALAWSPDGRTLAVGLSRGPILLVPVVRGGR